MFPAASVAGTSHTESQYFNVGKLLKDQVVNMPCAKG